MRISSQEIQRIGLVSILDQQSVLSKTQQQVASGKRILQPSDDPVATTQILELKQYSDTTEKYQQNAGAARDRLATSEGILQSVTDLLQRTRELAVQGNNASQSNETRKYIAAEVRQRLDELLGLANSRDGHGEYIFAGSKGSTEPFSRASGGGYAYAGDQAQRYLQIGDGRQVPDGNSGAEIFQLIRNGNGTFTTEAEAVNAGSGVIDGGSVVGNFIPSLTGGVNGYTIRFIQALPTDPVTYEVFETGDPQPTPHPTPVATGTYTEGEAIEFQGARVIIEGTPADGDLFYVKSSENEDVFQMLEDLATALEDDVTSASEQAMLNNRVGEAISNLDQALGNILEVRSSIGARLNTIDSQEYVNDNNLLQTKKVLSSLEDLDYAEAITRLNIQIAGLEAAQKAYTKIQGLSVFNYI